MNARIVTKYHTSYHLLSVESNRQQRNLTKNVRFNEECKASENYNKESNNGALTERYSEEESPNAIENTHCSKINNNSFIWRGSPQEDGSKLQPPLERDFIPPFLRIPLSLDVTSRELIKQNNPDGLDIYESGDKARKGESENDGSKSKQEEMSKDSEEVYPDPGFKLHDVTWDPKHWTASLHCGICFGYFQQSVMLPCGHTYCSNCISRVVKAKHRKSPEVPLGNVPVVCPNCCDTLSFDEYLFQAKRNVDLDNVTEAWRKYESAKRTLNITVEVKEDQLETDGQRISNSIAKETINVIPEKIPDPAKCRKTRKPLREEGWRTTSHSDFYSTTTLEELALVVSIFSLITFVLVLFRFVSKYHLYIQ